MKNTIVTYKKVFKDNKCQTFYEDLVHEIPSQFREI